MHIDTFCKDQASELGYKRLTIGALATEWFDMKADNVPVYVGWIVNHSLVAYIANAFSGVFQWSGYVTSPVDAWRSQTGAT